MEDNGSAQVVFLQDGGLVESTEDLIEKGKGTLGPDDETTDVATGSELEKVESPDVGELNTGQVPEGFDDTVVLGVDNERATTLTVSAPPELSLTSTELARVGDLDDVTVSLDGLQESDGLFCFLVGLDGGRDNEGNLGDFLDTVTAGKDEGGECRGGKRRDNGEAALVLVDLDVPFAPDLGGSEHATATAHVTERSLKCRGYSARIKSLV